MHFCAKNKAKLIMICFNVSFPFFLWSLLRKKVNWKDTTFNQLKNNGSAIFLTWNVSCACKLSVILISEITKSTEDPLDSTKLSLIYVIGMWGTKGGSIFCNYFPRCESDRLMVLGLITGARATIEESRDVFELYLLPLWLGIAMYFHSNE